MAIALQQATSFDFLLNQWRNQGWSQVRSGVVSQIPVGTSSGKILIPTQLDAFEWKDVTVFGIGNVDNALQQLASYIQQGGSQLHAYALFKRTDVDLFGVKIVSYRLLLYHSVVQLGIIALGIIAVAVAAIVFLQYIATGTPPLDSVTKLWGGIVKPVQDGVTGVVGSATSGIGQVWILAIVGAGAISLAFGMASKSTRTIAILGGLGIGAYFLTKMGGGSSAPAGLPVDGMKCAVVTGPAPGSGMMIATRIQYGVVRGGQCYIGTTPYKLSDPRVRVG